MRPTTRTRAAFAALAAAAAAAILAAPASATDYYAAPAATGSGSCADAANACTITTAMTAADNSAGTDPDRVFMAAGTYGGNLRIFLQPGKHDGMLLRGSGSDSATGTLVKPNTFNGGSAIQIGASNATVERLFVGDVNATTKETLIYVAGNGVVVRDVNLIGGSANQSAAAVQVSTGELTLQRADVSSGSRRAAVHVDLASNVTIEDSHLSANAGPTIAQRGPSGGKLNRVVVRRSAVRQQSAAETGILIDDLVAGSNVQTLVESSIVDGGRGIYSKQQQAGSNVAVDVRHSVLDGVTPYMDDMGPYSLSADGKDGVTNTFRATISNSIVFEDVWFGSQSGFDRGVVCSYTAIRFAINDPGYECGGDRGNISMFPFAMSDLFADVSDVSSGGMYTPKPGGPLVDAGDPTTPLAPGESATDRDGRARTINGNTDDSCAARTDMGAREVAQVACTPKAPPADPGTGGTGGGSTPPSTTPGDTPGGGTQPGGPGGNGTPGGPTRPAVTPALKSVSLKGATLKFSLNVAAKVTATVSVKPRGAKKAKRVKTVSLTGKAGANRAKLATKGLKPGTYSVELVATANGKRSKPATVRLTVKKK